MLKARPHSGATMFQFGYSFLLAMKSVETDGYNLSTVSSRTIQFLKFHNGGFSFYSQFCLSP
jgi:hypothetical protein